MQKTQLHVGQSLRQVQQFLTVHADVVPAAVSSAAKRTLLRKYVTPLVKFARASLRGAPEFASLTPSASDLERERLVRTAQALAQAADNHADALRVAAFPADFLEQLRSQAAAVQKAFDSGVSGRVRRTGVTREISSALAKGRQAVASLDALVAHTIVGDEALEAEWRSAKRVRRRAPAEVLVETEVAAAA